MSRTARAGGVLADVPDPRLTVASVTRRNLRKIFPDHWSFMLGEMALYSFIVLLLTGTFLTLSFKPSMTEVVYDGSYVPLEGVTMSEAYASTLDISFDVRGGLLVRQIHHWAALIFIAAIIIHYCRKTMCSPVTVFVIPGASGRKTNPGPRLTRAKPSAAWTAACSCRT